MSKDKNVFITLFVVALFALVWFGMYPKVTAWAAEQGKADVIECKAGYELQFLENGGIRITGDCYPLRPDVEPDEPVYDYPYPVPDEPYPYIDNPCDGDWAYGQECGE